MCVHMSTTCSIHFTLHSQKISQFSIIRSTWKEGVLWRKSQSHNIHHLHLQSPWNLGLSKLCYGPLPSFSLADFVLLYLGLSYLALSLFASYCVWQIWFHVLSKNTITKGISCQSVIFNSINSSLFLFSLLILMAESFFCIG